MARRGQTSLVGLKVDGRQRIPLLVGDPEAALHLDEVLEAQLPREAVGPTEGLGW
jgi:hypothetical protein